MLNKLFPWLPSLNLKLRNWQERCLVRAREVFKTQKVFALEATMASGKSLMAALLARMLIEQFDVDHVLVLAPFKSIQGDVERGLLGAFGASVGLDTRDRFFTLSRRQVKQPKPDMDATVTLYQEVCCPEAVDTIQMWQSEGFKFALVCDEIHHTNEINGTWGLYASKISELASYSVFMSGTYFRGDKKPLGCIPLTPSGQPDLDFKYPYEDALKDGIVRSISLRRINAVVTINDKDTGVTTECPLVEIKSEKELAVAKKEVLQTDGACVRRMIQEVHAEMLRTRIKFPDAACLFVCRPGGKGEYTEQEDAESRHVYAIAKLIKDLTGYEPTTITYKDKDAQGKISQFRKGSSPYLVAVNMVSEGCDIPRIRTIAFCRYTASEMLWRQIIARALRIMYNAAGQPCEDGTAASIFYFTFYNMEEYAKRAYAEAKAGLRRWICPYCNEKPCVCSPQTRDRCPICRQRPCMCLKPVVEDRLVGTVEPHMDGGRVKDVLVGEEFVLAAIAVIEKMGGYIPSNAVQLGAALQMFSQDGLPAGKRVPTPGMNPVEEREQLRRTVNRLARWLTFNRCRPREPKSEDFQQTFMEIGKQFKSTWKEIMGSWKVEDMREVVTWLEERHREVSRNGGNH